MKMVTIIVCVLFYGSVVFALDDAFILSEKCRKEKTKHDIVKCIGGDGFSLLHAYMSLYFAYSDPNPDEAWDSARLEALSNIRKNPNINKIRLQALKNINLGKDDFIELYEKAIIWGEEEFGKSADELYARSKTIADDISDESLKKTFQKRYLYMAKKKGHEQAGIEAEIMSEAFLKRLEEKRAK